MCDGVAAEDVYDTLETDEGVQQALAKLDDDPRRRHLVVGPVPRTPQLLADGEVVMGSTYNGAAVLGHRGAGPARRDALGTRRCSIWTAGSSRPVLSEERQARAR